MVGAGLAARVTPSCGQGARRPPSTPGPGAARRRTPGPRAEEGWPRPGEGQRAGRRGGLSRGRRAGGRDAQAFVAQPPLAAPAPAGGPRPCSFSKAELRASLQAPSHSQVFSATSRHPDPAASPTSAKIPLHPTGAHPAVAPPAPDRSAPVRQETARSGAGRFYLGNSPCVHLWPPLKRRSQATAHRTAVSSPEPPGAGGQDVGTCGPSPPWGGVRGSHFHLRGLRCLKAETPVWLRVWSSAPRSLRLQHRVGLELPGGPRVIKAFWTGLCGHTRFRELAFHERPSAKKGHTRRLGWRFFRATQLAFKAQALARPCGILGLAGGGGGNRPRSRAAGGEGALWPAPARLDSAAVATALPPRHR
ncbi:translation initiation factor IF-2-like [Sciurus carolinensis]|uniref:translation initiation factor IF-2-like n=1 Tax=Sciurus carolinensis TaxID=30640 RepID=UPI001FB2DAEF|nr:translation initiation factor IF-2-like [Sciurus carolinensis]